MKKVIIGSVLVLACAAIVYSCGDNSSSQTAQSPGGAQIYMDNCVVCHGQDGKAGLSGASDLSVSVLSHEAAVDVVMHGRNGMRAFSELSKEQIDEVVTHIETLRKK